LFRELNDRAERRFLKVACKLFAGKNLSQRPQDTSEGQNLKLKNWTPKVRYRLAKQIKKWEKTGILE
jgi:hypothetical protein